MEERIKQKFDALMQEAKATLSQKLLRSFLRDVAEFQNTVIEETIEVEVEEEKLFDRKLSEVIAYLTGLKKQCGDFNLVQRWAGYEQNYFVVETIRRESEDEHQYGVWSQGRKRLDYYKELMKEEEKRKHNAEILKQIKALKEKLM